MSRRIVWKARGDQPRRADSARPGSRRLSRFLLNPLYMIPLLFAAQIVIWYFGMPVDPAALGDSTLATASPRFSSETAVLRYAALLVAMLAGLVFGHSLLPRRPRTQNPGRPSPSRVAALMWAARLAGVAALIGEVFYARTVLSNPAMLIGAVQEGAFGDVGMAAATSRMVGISSLNNLFLVTSAICSIVAFHPGVPSREAASARRWLIGITFVCLVHSLILSARMFFIYHVCAMLGGFALTRPGELEVRRLVRLFALALLLVWGGETLRGGLLYATRNNTGLLSAATQRSVMTRLAMAYVASDFNNAMYILNSRPSMQFVSTTIAARTLKHPVPYPLPGSYGTVNSLALWWYDAGWTAALIAFIVGAWMTFAYSVAVRQAATIGPMVPFFMVTYPGVFACARINYFMNSIFVAPTVCLLATAALLRLLVRLRAEYRAIHPPVEAPG